jgi:hypothetical protein
MSECYWGDQAFGSYSGRVPSTGEYIGPYDSAEELAREIEACEREAREDRGGEGASGPVETR